MPPNTSKHTWKALSGCGMQHKNILDFQLCTSGFQHLQLVATSGQGQEIQNQALQSQAWYRVLSELEVVKLQGVVAWYMCLGIEKGSREERQSHQGHLTRVRPEKQMQWW